MWIPSSQYSEQTNLANVSFISCVTLPFSINFISAAIIFTVSLHAVLNPLGFALSMESLNSVCTSECTKGC